MRVRSAALLTGIVLGVGSFASVSVAASAPSAASQTAISRPWMNTRLSPAERARLLVAQMTLDEKIAMVHGAGLSRRRSTPAGYAGVVPANTRLGIPALYLADSPGRRRQRLDRRHPVGRHLGPGLHLGHRPWPRRTAAPTGPSRPGKGHNIALMPTINILRLPLWGRAPETFSEDPYLTGAQAAAEIRAVQSNHVIATTKHFVANNQEVLRSHINVVAAQRTLQEIYQPAFKMAVQQGGTGAIMCSYNRVNGTYACENAEELTDVLRDAWKFDGLVMSDWGALHSTVKAARAGMDLEMPGAADENNLTPDRPDLRQPVLREQAQGRRARTAPSPSRRSTAWSRTSSPRCSGSGCSTTRCPTPPA